MSEDSKPEEPKIIVDDDWKSQVEKEKAELKGKEADSKEADLKNAEPESFEMPPANFIVLMSTLATQSMAALGFIPDPVSGKPRVNRPMAKHFIDTLAMLQEKTKGNLTEEESSHLRDTLHQLRMAYVGSAEQGPVENEVPETTSKIELP